MDGVWGHPRVPWVQLSMLMNSMGRQLRVQTPGSQGPRSTLGGSGTSSDAVLPYNLG